MPIFELSKSNKSVDTEVTLFKLKVDVRVWTTFREIIKIST